MPSNRAVALIIAVDTKAPDMAVHIGAASIPGLLMLANSAYGLDLLQ